MDIIELKERIELNPKDIEGLINFARQYNYAINDPELIRRYRMIEDGRHDLATKLVVAERKAMEKGISEGLAKGMEKGMEKGRLETTLKNAKGFKEQGVDPIVIATVTGLSLDEIAKL